MNIKHREILQELINYERIEDKIAIFRVNKELFKDIKIILFDEEKSNFKNFGEKSYGKYYLCSLGDYNRAWILDCENLDKFELKVTRKIYFDINMISRIDNLVRGAHIGDKNDLIDFLKYVKEVNCYLDIGTAVIERLSKECSDDKFRKSIESFLKFGRSHGFTREITENKISATDIEYYYNKCREIGLKCWEDKVLIRQYDIILCLLVKAILIKADRKISNKVDELIRFGLEDLNCVMMNELYILCLYLLNDQRVVKSMFAKLHSNYKKGLRNAVENTAWDIYHSRMIEQDMQFYDHETHMVILPFFATNDGGLKNYWEINPRKMVIIDNGIAHFMFNHNVNEIITDTDLYESLISSSEIQRRNNELDRVDIDSIKEKLLPLLDEVTI